MGGGGGGGDGGGGSEGGGGGGGEDASRAHRRKKKAARRRRALSCSALCAAARALLRSWRFDGSNGGESVAVPSAGLSLASGFGCIAADAAERQRDGCATALLSPACTPLGCPDPAGDEPFRRDVAALEKLLAASPALPPQGRAPLRERLMCTTGGYRGL